MKKKITLLLLVLAMVLSSAMTVFATENEEQVSTEWTAADFTYGTQTFSLYPAGEESKVLSVDAHVITGLSESGTSKIEVNKALVIPAEDESGNKIQGVGKNALQKLGLTSVTFPEGVKASYDETTWTSVGAGLTERGDFFIGYGAFSGNALETLELPDGVISVEGSAFKSNQLTSVKFPESIMMIQTAAFNDNNITTLDFPEVVDFALQIDNQTFGDNFIQEVQLPTNLEKMHKNSFVLNTGFEKVTTGTDAEKASGLVYIYINAETVGSYVTKVSPVQKIILSETMPEHNFSDEWTVLEPTCMHRGCEKHACTDEGCTRFEGARNIVEPLGHEQGELVSTKAPTCTAGGYSYYACARSGCSYEKIKADLVDKLGHEPGEVLETVEPTCTEAGYTKHQCTRCSNKNVKVEVPATGHAYETVVTEPTCTEAGYTTYTCKNVNNGEACGDTYVADEVAALGHAYETVVTEPTCTEAGYTTYTCAGCGDSYTADEVSATGHNYTSEMTKAPTCTAAGETTYTCTACKDSYKEEISKTGHSYKTVITKATLSANGKKETKCNVCNHVSKKVTIYKAKTPTLSYTKCTYTGNVKTPKVTVKDSKGNVLKKDTDYTVKYVSGRKKVGKYTVTITFQGNYKGTKTRTFYILPGKTSKLSTATTKSTLKASWNKVTGATGYRVQLLSSDGKVLRTKYTTNKTYKFESLKKSKTYKVKVTAYKKIDGKRYYSLKAYTVKATTKKK